MPRGPFLHPNADLRNICFARTLMAGLHKLRRGSSMKSFQWLAITVGIAALAACGGDEVNQTNVEINAAEDNLALPPADMNADMNASLNADMNATNNMATNNTTENTTNSY